MTDMNLNKDRMDDALKSALRRQEAPDGFADRVLARVAMQNQRPSPRAIPG